MKKLQFFYKYKWLLLGGGAFFLAAGLGLIGFQIYETNQNQKAEQEIYKKRKTLLEAEKKHGGDVLSKLNYLPSKKAKDAKLFSKELGDYIQFLKGLKAARPPHLSAALELSYFLIEYAKKDEALSLLDEVFSKSQGGGFVRSALILRLSDLYMEEKNYKRALYLLSLILNDKKAEAFYFEALLRSAFCHEALGSIKEAGEIYTLIKNKENAGFYREKAINYERLMKIKKKTQKKAEASL